MNARFVSRANGAEDGDGLGTVAAAIYSDVNIRTAKSAREKCESINVNYGKTNDADHSCR